MDAQPQEKRIQKERTTQEQLQFFVQFCNEHPELQRGKCVPNNPQLLQKLWTEMADTLNSMRGPTRSAAKWKESLMHWKHQLRSRARRIKTQAQMTGGGPQTSDITEFEQRAIATFGSAAVDGLPDVPGTLGYQDLSPLSVIVEEVSSPPPATSTFALTADASPTTVVGNVASPAVVVLANAEASPIPSPTAAKKMSSAAVLNAVMANVEARDRREEQAIAFQERIVEQNTGIAAALTQVAQALTGLTEAITKFIEKN